MNYLGFHNSLQLGEPVDSDSPIEIESNVLVDQYLPSLKADGEFFGAIDAAGTVLQVAYLSDENEYWIETPRPDLGGSYCATFDLAGAQALLSKLEKEFPLDGFESFEFQSWS